VREALAEVEEDALGRPGGLISKLRVPDLRRVDAAGELACGDVRIEALEGHLLVRHGILLAGPAKARRLLPSGGLFMPAALPSVNAPSLSLSAAPGMPPS